MKRRRRLWIGVGAALVSGSLIVVSVLMNGHSHLTDLVAMQAQTHGMVRTNDLGSADPHVIRPESGIVYLGEGVSKQEQLELSSVLDARLKTLGYKEGHISALTTKIGRAGASGRAWVHGSDTGNSIVELMCFSYGSRTTTMLVVDEHKRGIGERIADWLHKTF